MVTKSMKRFASLAVTGVLALSLAACGDDGSTENGNSDGGTPAAKKVGVILPDATTSARWEANDRPSLQAAFDAADIESDIQNAGGDVAKFQEICDAMISSGVQVLMIVNLDSDSGSACLKKATEAGIKSIDYDRLTLGGGASYYVSFDNVEVGRLQGQGLIDCLDAKGKTKANIVYVNGAATDNNATLFKNGYAEALAEKIDSGDYTLVGDQSGEWDPEKAGTVFEQMWTENKGKIDGAVTANDGMAGGVIARLVAAGAAGKVGTTGQDATVEGLQNVLLGYQCGTVYKNTDLEADAASALAIALINGEDASTLATGSVTDTETGEEVASALATPVWITAENMQQVFDDGFATTADVCTGKVAAACKKAGIK
jgi:D-xylose transport system substrate-binding protein